MKTNKDICAIVVTYNRLDLLKNCIQKLRNQTRKIDKIIVVNNGSTDGTEVWLREQDDIHTINQENLGCSAGFNTGISKAIELGYDWIWLMDDDLNLDLKALQELLDAASNYGFENAYCSVPISDQDRKTIFWPGLLEKEGRYKYYQTNYDKLSAAKVFEAAQFPFLGILLNKKHIENAGLPLKELFIWCDDTEFSWRLKKKNNCKLFFVRDSIAYHPPVNFQTRRILGFKIRIVDAPMWKIYYGLRNDCYINKVHKNKISFYSYWLPKRLIKITLQSVFFYRGNCINVLTFFFDATIAGLKNKLGIVKSKVM